MAPPPSWRHLTRLPGGSYILRRLAGYNRGRGGIILAFHEVTEKYLQTTLDHISQHYEFASLTELIERLSKGKSTAGLAAITFDDGFESVVKSASSIAHGSGWPMTFFLPVRFLSAGEPPWFDTLRPLLSSVPWDHLEVDGRDGECVQLLLQCDGADAGTARLREHDGAAKIERVAVLAEARARGLGRRLMDALEAEARRRGFAEVVLYAQVGVIAFYEKLGYVSEGERFVEADIPHQAMRKGLRA